ncbi:MAG: MmgE/PrpD family protein [Methanobacteriaceae archaeon]
MNTDEMAHFIQDAKYKDLSPGVVEQAKLCFLDFLGVSLAGSRSRSGEIMRSIINSEGPSTIIGGSKASASDASLVNGVSAHSLDLDDGHRLAQLHPGACVIPAALSLAESEELSGREFLVALVVGYQVAVSLGIMVNPSHRNIGFHSTGTCGTFAAAAAAGKVLKLSEDEILNCLGLAGTQAAGLLESDHSGSMAKHLHPGRAAQSGVISALISQRGFTGARSILEGEEGFLNSMCQLHDKQNEFKVLPDSSYHISGVYFKNYPVCRHLHSALDATLYLSQKYEINPRDVVEVKVKTYQIAAEHHDYNAQEPEAIRQSLPVTVALAIFQGHLEPKELQVNEDILNLASRVSIECDPSFEALYPGNRPAQVRMNTIQGSFEKTVHLPRGEPEEPFKWDDLLFKFKTLNPQFDVDTLDIIKKMESYNLNDLMTILS